MQNVLHAFGDQGAPAAPILGKLGQPDQLYPGRQGKLYPHGTLGASLMPGPVIIESAPASLSSETQAQHGKSVDTPSDALSTAPRWPHDISGIGKGEVHTAAPKLPDPSQSSGNNPQASYILVYRGTPGDDKSGIYFELDLQNERVISAGSLGDLQTIEGGSSS
ncbi:hypothetical protein IWQ60_011187 [Tieghemiomyces parasiticus]|uniref:Uncharacterized protein n=1 Tax=Tieghemiomyces parasiticus TaxID=78921 RepID=A0A9W7ZPI1_9FUNG|nr:hypothetical protein IWQ60_011187 [Tieghemiomyces parasiticus]